MKRTLRNGDSRSPYSVEVVIEGGHEEFYLVSSKREGFEERKNLHCWSDEQALDELMQIEEKEGYLPRGFLESKSKADAKLWKQDEEHPYEDVRIFNFQAGRVVSNVKV